jgi:dipeptide/tripeptide permease
MSTGELMAATDAGRLGLWGQIKSFEDRVLLMVWMEAIERFAYYGVRMVVPLYIVGSVAGGGLEFTHIQKGSIYFWWAGVQSFLPVFTGNFADRYGYKKTIAVAIIIKAIGYAMMASMTSYGGFLAGCLMLAAGTAIFKPGVQGVLGNTLPEESRSVGWGLFYQFVNIGAMFAPIIAGLRFQSWAALFYGCAIAVSLNLLALPFFKDPRPPAGKYERPDGDPKKDNMRSLSMVFTGGFMCLLGIFGTSGMPLEGMAPVLLAGVLISLGVWAARVGWVGLDARGEEPFRLIWEAIKDILRPRLLLFIIAFSLFWLGFTQLFDVLPNYIDDWVNSSDLIAAASGAFEVKGVPILVTLIVAGLAAFVVNAFVWVGLRPDRGPSENVPNGGWIPVWGGLTFAGGLIYMGVLGLLGTLGVAFPEFLSGALMTIVATLAIGGALTRLFHGLKPPYIAVTLIGSVLAFAGTMMLLQSPAAGAAETLSDMAAKGVQIPQEWLFNVNPISISLLTVFVSYILGFFRPLTAIMIGMVISIVGILMVSNAATGWLVLGALAIFTLGEMTCSPKKMEYLSLIAPPGEQGKYMGYANMPTAIGWMVGAKLMGSWYENHGDKVNLARRHLEKVLGMTEEQVKAIAKDDVMPTLAGKLNLPLMEAQEFLRELYNPGIVWVWLGIVGSGSIVLMFLYNRWVQTEALKEANTPAEAS